MLEMTLWMFGIGEHFYMTRPTEIITDESLWLCFSNWVYGVVRQSRQWCLGAQRSGMVFLMFLGLFCSAGDINLYLSSSHVISLCCTTELCPQTPDVFKIKEVQFVAYNFELHSFVPLPGIPQKHVLELLRKSLRSAALGYVIEISKEAYFIQC